MLDKQRTAILFTANTPHLAHANLMLDSLRNIEQGNFKGDIWVISTGLSERAKNYCDSRNIKYLISPMNDLYNWNNWWRIAESQPEFLTFIKSKDRNRSLRQAFEIYRNKRMSKLILLDWVKKFGSRYDFIALGDNDLYFQNDIHELFQYAFSKASDKIHYWHEENEITVGSWIWKKDFQYARFYDTSDLNFGKHEINIGFILGSPESLYNAFDAVKKDFFSLNLLLFTKFFWHDQDLIRLDRARSPEKYELLPEGNIVHLCNGGENVIVEKETAGFYHIKTEKKPYVIHFAGGAWKKYQSIKETYMVDPETYYYSCERAKDYTLIKNRTRKEIFSEVNGKYFSQENYKTRKEGRIKWVEKTKNGKKNILLMGWLAVPTHNKSICDVIPAFFKNEYYNIACLVGNVTNQEFGDLIYEEFPNTIASLTSITYDAQLISYFGIKLDEIPEWVIEDGLAAAKIEYGCTDATARAIVNLIYLYVSEALDFYRPDLAICICTTGLFGKVAKNVCKEKNIPLADMEWGVLPGTITFDIEGHMADSWVSKYSDYFNTLPISDEDINIAESYLSLAKDPELSRNKPQAIREDIYWYIQDLKNQGKKIILYMESNSAGSGNSFVNEEAAKVHSPYFKDDTDAYEAILTACKKHDDWHILYKPHPISITRGLHTRIDEKYTTVIYEGALQECLEFADLSVTLLSQSAYVSLIYNVPVLILGSLQLNASGAAYVYSEKCELEKMMQQAFDKGFSKQQKRYFKEHVARVLRYYVYSANEKVKCNDSNAMAKNLYGILTGNYESYYKYEYMAYLKQKKLIKKIKKIQKPEVSVIMPVHNVEDYLAQSISSIINQTKKNIELICVENGSKDNSYNILKYYEQIDGRITVIHTDKIGASNARNEGLLEAKGKYIYFMDSDDYLDQDALEKLTEIAKEKDIDLLYFFYREVHPGISTAMNRPRYYSYERYFPEEEIFALNRDLMKFFIQYPFPPLKLFRRELLTENNLYFDNNCKIAEDNLHNIQSLLIAKNPYVYNKQLYNYRRRKGSSTTSFGEKAVTMPYLLNRMNEEFEKKNIYSIVQKWYVPYKAYLAAWCWTLIPDKDRESYIKECIEAFRDGDAYYIDADDSWGFFELPILPFARRLKSMLLNGGEIKSIEKSENIENDFEEIVEIQPWEKISKPHLAAIKVCEKLHIINFAIKVKKFFMGSK